MKKKLKYPKVYSLLAGRFHLDWDCDYNIPEEVLTSHIKKVTKSSLIQLIAELNELLKEEHNKEEWLHIIYDEFECYCNAEVDGMNPKDWLRWVLSQLERGKHLARDVDNK